jgi:hypothetical protein
LERLRALEKKPVIFLDLMPAWFIEETGRALTLVKRITVFASYFGENAKSEYRKHENHRGD